MTDVDDLALVLARCQHGGSERLAQFEVQSGYWEPFARAVIDAGWVSPQRLASAYTHGYQAALTDVAETECDGGLIGQLTVIKEPDQS